MWRIGVSSIVNAAAIDSRQIGAMRSILKQHVPKHDMWLFAAPIMWMFIVLAAMIFVIFAWSARDATARSSSELSAHCGFRPTGRRSVASNHRHNTILLAVALSLGLNRGLFTLLPFRYRPMCHCGRPALEVEIIISFFARGLNQLRFVAQETIGGKAWLCDNASQGVP
jgi:hypothetical protein